VWKQRTGTLDAVDKLPTGRPQSLSRPEFFIKMGKFCTIRKSLVNKGLAMLQMLVAKSGHEKDHHARAFVHSKRE